MPAFGANASTLRHLEDRAMRSWLHALGWLLAREGYRRPGVVRGPGLGADGYHVLAGGTVRRLSQTFS